MTIDQLNSEFENFRAPLKSYLLRLVTNVQETEDIVQDTWLKASQKIDSFREDSSLKTWIFTIASNLAKDHLRSQKRWVEEVTDICKEAALQNQPFFQKAMEIRMTSPQGHFEIKEHITFCFTCISKSLPLEQHIAVLLKEVYDFTLKENAEIMDTTDAMVKYHLHTGRSKMIDIFEGRCSLINKEGVCHQCTELNGIFNPKQNAEEERVKIKMVREAEKQDKSHLFDLRMLIVRGIDPFESDGAELQLHHLEHNRTVMEDFLKKVD